MTYFEIFCRASAWKHWKKFPGVLANVDFKRNLVKMSAKAPKGILNPVLGCV